VCPSPQIQNLCRLVRPNAVALVDAFNYSDAVLGSFIGAADGDIYTRCAAA
jgi:acyl-CoA oxidase